MALGAITVTTRAGGSPSRPLHVIHLDVVGHASVPAGGMTAVTAAISTALGKQDVTIVDIVGDGYVISTGLGSEQHVKYVHATDKLMIIATEDGTEVTGDQSLNHYRLTVFAQ